jgi:molecular chaperone GrpE
MTDLRSEAAREASSAHPDSGAQTAVLPETAAALVELEQLRTLLAAAEERARNHWDQYLRSVAELDNVRKRAQRDIENASRYGLEKFAQEILPVKESLDLAVENSARADGPSLIAGQQATHQLLTKAFAKLGIVEVNPLGEPFDPAAHEAMLMQESATAEPNSVIQVVQRGYSLNGRLLRPARVIVAKPPA